MQVNEFSVKLFQLCWHLYPYAFPCVVAHVKMASFVLELWFRWHQSLWNYCPLSVKVWISNYSIVLS